MLFIFTEPYVIKTRVYAELLIGIKNTHATFRMNSAGLLIKLSYVNVSIEVLYSSSTLRRIQSTRYDFIDDQGALIQSLSS